MRHGHEITLFFTDMHAHGWLALAKVLVCKYHGFKLLSYVCVVSIYIKCIVDNYDS
jgi:hypothetical protein